jgi:hypothetical protein
MTNGKASAMIAALAVATALTFSQTETGAAMVASP